MLSALRITSRQGSRESNPAKHHLTTFQYADYFTLRRSWHPFPSVCLYSPWGAATLQGTRPQERININSFQNHSENQLCKIMLIKVLQVRFISYTHTQKINISHSRSSIVWHSYFVFSPYVLFQWAGSSSVLVEYLGVRVMTCGRYFSSKCSFPAESPFGLVILQCFIEFCLAERMSPGTYHGDH